MAKLEGDTDTQCYYNASTHKVVTLDTVICNSSEICSSPEANSTQNLSHNGHCDTEGESYFLGIFVGVVTSLVTAGICASIYMICNSRPQRGEETEEPSLHAPELLPIAHEADDGKFADG